MIKTIAMTNSSTQKFQTCLLANGSCLPRRVHIVVVRADIPIVHTDQVEGFHVPDVNIWLDQVAVGVKNMTDVTFAS